ncbi:hypothetical protein GF339_23305 [candidate division KSB3 bacterium]|uniref:AbrB family transcriptional regulator n=1 Tax=candidate division KSB3 bacterium TaxID=2044937 RepID=A0A9D5K1I8_9BACT|nr:hypothetical protein [candidate division KSB3 bacterium]MBD3327532.1 hypothetical protein [candidate division KSB3 bacterium]
MSPMVWQFVLYVGVGTFGGFWGSKLKIPAGTMLGAVVSVFLLRLLFKIEWELPKSYEWWLQIFLGILLGTSFHPAMFKTLYKMALPIVFSTITLVSVGIVLSLLFARFGILDSQTAYLGTSPGAMSSLILLASQSQADAPLITCFHFFRLFAVILTAPFVLKYFFSS